MKTKHILFTMATAAFFAACTNDEFETTSVDYSNLQKIDASNYALVSVPNGELADTRLVAVPGYDQGGGDWTFPAPQWEWGQDKDAIGFSLIYPSDQCLTTNYRFYIKDASDIGTNGNATFRTDETTIFGGDYFVYYPYNENFKGAAGDPNIGIPFALDAIQAQNTADPVKASDKSNVTDSKYTTAVKHLNEFRISNRVKNVQAGVQQSEFSTKRYTATLNFRIFPKNQTKSVAVKRVEMVCDEGFVVNGKFQAKAGVDEPQFVEEEGARASKLVLTFNNLNDDPNQNGLNIAADTKEKDAYMGYMSVCPGTYSNVKFYVYYTETGNMKRVVIPRESVTLETNNNYRVALPVDANGAEEVTSYDIYSESEFAAAVKKSNAMNAGTDSKAVFTLMDDITLTDAYTLDAKVPVTFEGGKTITLARSQDVRDNNKVSLKITSNQAVVINNTIKGGDAQHMDIKVGDASVAGNNPEVTIAAVQSETLHLTCDRGKLTVKNETVRGSVASLYNRSNMVIEYADVKGDVKSVVYNNNAADKPVISLKEVNVGGNFENYNGGEVSTLDEVNVTGKFTNTANAKMDLNDVNVTGMVENYTGATLNVTGTNNFGAMVADKLANVANLGTINVAEEAEVTLGIVTASGVMNIDGTAVAKGATTMTGLMTLNGTYTAEGALNVLKQDYLNLEGTLNTKGKVGLQSALEICGVINNSGSWTLGEGISIKQRNHAHSAKNAEFNNSGVVTVEGITTTTSPAINNMPKTLYKKVDNGRLIWRGMETVAVINEFVEMDECWATDFNAVLKPSANTSETLNVDGSWNWSSANVIIDLEAQGGYVTTLNITNPLTIQNLDINLGETGGITTSSAYDGNDLIISNKFSLTGGYTTFDASCDILTKDLWIEATKQGNTGEDKFIVKKAEDNIKFTGNYTQVNGKNINFTDGSPVKQ